MMLHNKTIYTLKTGMALLLMSCVGLQSCKHAYTNTSNYILAVGKTIEIYYTTNSCCYYCISNVDALKHVELVGTKTVDPGPKGCDGCDYTAAFIFKGKSVGTDTIKLNHQIANTSCNGDPDTQEIYVITVH